MDEVTICNLALAYMGNTRALTSTDGTVANVDQTGEHARMCQLFYEPCRDTVLGDFPWPFATKYVELVLLNDGDDEPWSGEWANAYSKPADCLVVRRFLTTALTTDTAWWQVQVQHDYIYPPFEIKQIDGEEAILTDVAEDMAFIEYTAKITDATLYSSKFAIALARRIAYDLSTAMRVNAEIIRSCLQLYQLEIDNARRALGNEDDPRQSPDGDWISSRSC